MASETTWCQCLRRAGVAIPRWQQAQQAWHEGLLTVREEHDRLLGRHVIVARLHSHRRDAELVPALLDVRLVWVEGYRWVLSGLERDELNRRDAAQAWLLQRGRMAPEDSAGRAS